MKSRRIRPFVFALLSLCGLAIILQTSSRPAWADDNYRQPRRDASGFWGRGYGAGTDRYPTTAEISQALYGTDPSQYDTSERDTAPEVVNKAG